MTEKQTEPVAVAPVLLTMSTDQLRELIASLPANSPASGLTPEALKDILTANRAEQESRRSVRHSNADHQHISAFSFPEGDLKHPKARLTRETYFNNHRTTEDECTPLEIECFNAITATCSARDGKWTAVIDQGGRRLRVEVPSFTGDDRADLPPVTNILKELALGTKAVTPLDMMAQIEELRRMVEAQQAAQAGQIVLA